MASPVPFDVFLIESRSAGDHYDGRLEGRGLRELLTLSEVSHTYRDVIDRRHLKKALREAGERSSKPSS